MRDGINDTRMTKCNAIEVLDCSDTGGDSLKLLDVR